MLLKNFIVSLATGVAAPVTNNSYNPLYLKATTGSKYKIRSGGSESIRSISGSLYSNTTDTNGIDSPGFCKGIVLGTGTTPPYLPGL